MRPPTLGEQRTSCEQLARKCPGALPRASLTPRLARARPLLFHRRGLGRSSQASMDTPPCPHTVPHACSEPYRRSSQPEARSASRPACGPRPWANRERRASSSRGNAPAHYHAQASLPALPGQGGRLGTPTPTRANASTGHGQRRRFPQQHRAGRFLFGRLLTRCGECHRGRKPRLCSQPRGLPPGIAPRGDGRKGHGDGARGVRPRWRDRQ